MGRRSLARRRDFQHAFRSGRRGRSDGLTVWVAPSGDPEAPARLGLSVRRAVGNAVTRNRVKRRIRAAFGRSGPDSGVDVVVRVEPEAARKNFQEVEVALDEALRAAGAR